MRRQRVSVKRDPARETGVNRKMRPGAHNARSGISETAALAAPYRFTQIFETAGKFFIETADDLGAYDDAQRWAHARALADSSVIAPRMCFHRPIYSANSNGRLKGQLEAFAENRNLRGR
jgi:hypothetical protein